MPRPPIRPAGQPVAEAIRQLPDWVLRPPARAVDPRVALGNDPPMEAPPAGRKACEQWEVRRAAYLQERGLPSAYSAETREFWRAMRAEAERREVDDAVERPHAGVDDDSPDPM